MDKEVIMKNLLLIGVKEVNDIKFSFVSEKNMIMIGDKLLSLGEAFDVLVNSNQIKKE